jgi:6-pyruvoyltetrahydropterin/6-carboxytetrahydropterin synthase
MYVIRKKFSFSAAHQLYGLPDNHPCMRLHGHNYEVEVVLRSSVLDETGFVHDYRDLDEFKQYLDTVFDHRNLNDILRPTTAEWIAQNFYDWCKRHWPETCAVLVSETPKTWAEYNDGL